MIMYNEQSSSMLYRAKIDVHHTAMQMTVSRITEITKLVGPLSFSAVVFLVLFLV